MITSFTGRWEFLSNFSPAQIEYEGIVYPTLEHAYQAAKTLHNPTRRKIAELKTPGQAKRFGKQITLRLNWDLIKIHIMQQLLEKKFKIPALRQALLETGDEFLIEGNTWGDKFWGAVLVNVEWVGENHLGSLLMQVRREIRQNLLTPAQIECLVRRYYEDHLIFLLKENCEATELVYNKDKNIWFTAPDAPRIVNVNSYDMPWATVIDMSTVDFEDIVVAKQITGWDE